MKRLIILFALMIVVTHVFSQEVSKDSIATLKLREKILKLNTSVNYYQQSIAYKMNDIVSYNNKLEEAKLEEIKAIEESKKMVLKVKDNHIDKKLARAASKAFKKSTNASKLVIKYQDKITDAKSDIVKLEQKNAAIKQELSTLETKIKFIKN